MNGIIKLVLSLSLSGSILAMIIFAAKPFIKHRISKAIQYYLWIIVLFRLLLPFSFEQSLMNKAFYGEKVSLEISSKGSAPEIAVINEGAAAIQSNDKENFTEVLNKASIYDLRTILILINSYSVQLWLIGAIIVFGINLSGYARFLRCIERSNKPATLEENRLLSALFRGRMDVRLARNRLIKTPMLIGLRKPCILIPDENFDEKQLKNILLHELTHFRRFDIAVKWVTIAAASIHWFNPLMYFIKREINHACELACDEAVIKSLNSKEKQAYGETLISIAADNKCPSGLFGATMAEDKNKLKDRLVSIMKYSGKSKFAVGISIFILSLVMAGSICLGAGVGHKRQPERLSAASYNLTEISKYKTPYIGNNSKVSAIANLMPAPNSYYRQRYISMDTDERPYKLKVYYESKYGTSDDSKGYTIDPFSSDFSIMQKNALVLFCMIGNLEEATFYFRDSNSDGKLVEEAYTSAFTFTKASIEESFGSISDIEKNIKLLEKALLSDKAYKQSLEASKGNFTALDKLPKHYNAPVSLSNGDVVFYKGETYNSQKLTAFYESFKKRKADTKEMQRITTYAKGNDALIYDIIIDGLEVKLLVDYTRSEPGTASNNELNEYKIADITKNEKEDSISYSIVTADNKGMFTFSVYDK